MHSEILAPVTLLVIWSLVMLVWLMAVRGPAFKQVGLDVRTFVGGHPGALDKVLPERAQWPAHNYIHLMEQPTLFYAISLVLVALGAGDGPAAILAWAYVVLRILHSVVQATFNRVLVRFTLFMLATLALMGMAGIAAREIWFV